MGAIVVPDLRDDDFALRPWRERDLPSLLEGFLDPEVQRFSWPGAEPYTEADGRAFIADRTTWLADGTCADVAIVEAADEDAILGGASVYDIEAEARRASTGYWLAPRARGRGIATPPAPCGCSPPGRSTTSASSGCS